MSKPTPLAQLVAEAAERLRSELADIDARREAVLAAIEKLQEIEGVGVVSHRSLGGSANYLKIRDFFVRRQNAPASAKQIAAGAGVKAGPLASILYRTRAVDFRKDASGRWRLAAVVYVAARDSQCRTSRPDGRGG